MPAPTMLRPSLGLVLLAAAAVPAQTTHWAYRPLPDASGPVDIDARLATDLDRAGLTRSPPADRTTLVRRLHLVLHGLPPTPADVAAASTDPGPDWFERRVDALLASRHWAERLAQAWLDVARYADTHGFETNTPRPNAWRYRDWVIDALHRDLPFDRFVIAQLAGDAIGEPAATGFLVAGPWDEVKSPDPRLTAEQRSNELADMVGTTGMAFLATTVGCARCHDHKFDPVRQTDFHAVEAVFAGVRHGDRELPPPDDALRRTRLAEIDERLADIDAALAAHQPLAGRHAVTVIDDEDDPRVEILVPKAGHGTHPAGTGRGMRDDPGDPGRVLGAGRGRYTWWRQLAPGQDAIAWRPGLVGAHRLWVSWGAGFDTHCQDATWLLDVDGDLATRDDQQELAVVDQQHFARRDGEPVRDDPLPGSPRCSGFLDVGVVALTASSRIVLRGGATGTALTADAIVLQPTEAGDVPAWRPPVDPLGNVDRFAPTRARAVRFVVDATLGGVEPCIDELIVEGPDAVNVALASRGAVATASSEYPGNPRHRIHHANDGRVGNDRSWIPSASGAAWLQIDFAAPAVIDRARWARDATGAFSDRLATQYRIEVRDDADRWRTVATSADRLPHGAMPGPRRRFLPDRLADDSNIVALLTERDALTAERATLATLPRGYAGRFETPPPTRRLHRGDPMAPREVVPPGGIAAFGALQLAADTLEAERRLALAHWLTRDARHLLARVIVNRVWQHLFGTGLVTTPNDFGRNGAAPSHPELLDALAAELIADGWSLRRLTRRIVLSATWRQSYRVDPAAVAHDASNRLLWRHPLRRLDAEPIRDALLAVSGELDPTPGGPGFDVFAPNDNYVRVYEPRTTFGADAMRRAIYAARVRMERDPTFGAFDCPDAASSTPRRSRSTTPQQALSLLNSPFVVDRAAAFAARVAREAGDTAPGQVDHAFRLALQRPPEPDERAAAVALVAAHGLPALCRALFQTNEFLFVP